MLLLVPATATASFFVFIVFGVMSTLNVDLSAAVISLRSIAGDLFAVVVLTGRAYLEFGGGMLDDGKLLGFMVDIITPTQG